jgi:hypothetical protein
VLIYPGQKINIPSLDDVKTLEQKVIDLVNQTAVLERAAGAESQLGALPGGAL